MTMAIIIPNRFSLHSRSISSIKFEQLRCLFDASYIRCDDRNSLIGASSTRLNHQLHHHHHLTRNLSSTFSHQKYYYYYSKQRLLDAFAADFASSRRPITVSAGNFDKIEAKSNDGSGKSSGSGTKTSRTPEDIHVKPKISENRKLNSPSIVGRNFVTTTRAMREYALDISDLIDLRKFQRRSPYNNEPPITVYLRKDVEAKALSIWKTWERLNEELRRRKIKEESYSDSLLIVKKYNKDYRRLNTPQAKVREEILRKSGRVVMAAVVINGANCFLKFFAWLYTGSHSLFAESVHSLADTCNQLILAYGIRKSIQVPNKSHPYGYHPMRFIASLISGVGIFCTGTGLSVYHGIHGILHPEPVGSYHWAFIILIGSFISEGGTLWIALDAARKAAASQHITLREYILQGNDPTLNVVILEDFAAVLGVGIAATCMGLTAYTQTPIYDACGSLMIGALLGVVASFVIVTNTDALIGKSITPDRLAQINRHLESDSMVRAIHDVKATHMGNDIIRYKAEVDFDGRKLTQNYLDSIDLEALFNEIGNVQTIEECEEFMLKHGEYIVDLLGAEVDRIENELKQKHPQVRHVDLEVL